MLLLWWRLRGLAARTPKDRMQAVRRLQKYTHSRQRIVSALLTAFPRESDEPVLRALAEAIGEMGDGNAVVPFLKAVESLKWPTLKLRGKAEGMLAIAKNTIRQIGSAAILPLCRALQGESNFLRRLACRLLGEMNDRQATAPLIALLDSMSSLPHGTPTEECDITLRDSAFEALCNLGDPSSAAVLGGHTTHRSDTLALQIVRVLRDMKDNRAIPGLIAANLQDQRPRLSALAAHSLLRFQSPDAIQALFDRRTRFLARVHPTIASSGATPCEWCRRTLASNHQQNHIPVDVDATHYNSMCSSGFVHRRICCSISCRNQLDVCCWRCKKELPVAGVGFSYREIGTDEGIKYYLGESAYSTPTCAKELYCIPCGSAITNELVVQDQRRPLNSRAKWHRTILDA